MIEMEIDFPGLRTIRTARRAASAAAEIQAVWADAWAEARASLRRGATRGAATWAATNAAEAIRARGGFGPLSRQATKRWPVSDHAKSRSAITRIRVG